MESKLRFHYRTITASLTEENSRDSLLVIYYINYMCINKEILCQENNDADHIGEDILNRFVAEVES